MNEWMNECMNEWMGFVRTWSTLVLAFLDSLQNMRAWNITLMCIWMYYMEWAMVPRNMMCSEWAVSPRNMMCLQWPIPLRNVMCGRCVLLLNFNEGKEQLHRCLDPFFTLELRKLIMTIKIEKSMVGGKAHFTIQVHFIPFSGVFPLFI